MFMVIILMYVGIFIAQGWIMALLLKENWDLDDRWWFRSILVVLALVVYPFLVWLMWLLINSSVMRSLI